jgi:hypothetical protein
MPNNFRVTFTVTLTWLADDYNILMLRAFTSQYITLLKIGTNGQGAVRVAYNEATEMFSGPTFIVNTAATVTVTYYNGWLTMSLDPNSLGDGLWASGAAIDSNTLKYDLFLASEVADSIQPATGTVSNLQISCEWQSILSCS